MKRLVGRRHDAVLARLARASARARGVAEARGLLAALNAGGDHLAAAATAGHPWPAPRRQAPRVGARALGGQSRPGEVCDGDGSAERLQWSGRGTTRRRRWRRSTLEQLTHYNTGIHVPPTGAARGLQRRVRCWPAPVRLEMSATAWAGWCRAELPLRRGDGHAWRGGPEVFSASAPRRALERGGTWSTRAGPDANRLASAVGRAERRHQDPPGTVGGLGRPRTARRGGRWKGPGAVQPRRCQPSPGDSRRMGEVRGPDPGRRLVPRAARSATVPAERQWIGYEMGNLDLLHLERVYEKCGCGLGVSGVQ